jgi:hypothetical protein
VSLMQHGPLEPLPLGIRKIGYIYIYNSKYAKKV